MISAGAFVSAGYALSYWLTFACAYSDNGDATWRVPIALQITFALPAIPMLAFWMPDSPRWLILTGREKEALATIAALNDDEPDSFEVREEFLQIKDAILVMAQGSSANMFSNKDRRGFHRVALAYMIQVFQQGTGINLVLQYLSWIFFTRMGYSGWLSRLLASFSATTYFLSSFITVVGIDRFCGRRSLMMFGASGMSGCMILITITQYLWQMHDVNAGRVASTVFLFAFSMFFAVGWQGMAWLYQVEIVPLRIRGPANALSTKGNWMFNFMYGHLIDGMFELTNSQHRLHHSHRIHEHRLSHLDHLRMHELRHRPSHLLLLPRNRIPLSRRSRRHLLPRRGTTRQSLAQRRQDQSQRAALVRQARRRHWLPILQQHLA
jgi:hypothetical protein